MLCAQDNVALGLRLRGLDTANRHGIAQETGQWVGLEACVRYDALELARLFFLGQIQRRIAEPATRTRTVQAGAVAGIA